MKRSDVKLIAKIAVRNQSNKLGKKLAKIVAAADPNMKTILAQIWKKAMMQLKKYFQNPDLTVKDLTSDFNVVFEKGKVYVEDYNGEYFGGVQYDASGWDLGEAKKVLDEIMSQTVPTNLKELNEMPDEVVKAFVQAMNDMKSVMPAFAKLSDKIWPYHPDSTIQKATSLYAAATVQIGKGYVQLSAHPGVPTASKGYKSLMKDYKINPRSLAAIMAFEEKHHVLLDIFKKHAPAALKSGEFTLKPKFDAVFKPGYMDLRCIWETPSSKARL